MLLSRGRTDSQLSCFSEDPGEPLFLVDESVSPNVAKALRKVGYRTRLVREIADFAGVIGVKDEQLIPWMGINGAVWVHADNKARRRHRKLLIAHNVRTLWLHRPNGQLSSRQQLKALSYVMERFINQLIEDPGQRHYAVRIRGAHPRTTVQFQTIPRL